MRDSFVTLKPPTLGVAIPATAERASAAFASAVACAVSFSIFSSSVRDSATRASTLAVSKSQKNHALMHLSLTHHSSKMLTMLSSNLIMLLRKDLLAISARKKLSAAMSEQRSLRV